jgi:flagellar basal-body rod protein FlgC
MDSFGVFKISASALEAQRKRMNIIASNLANVHSTKTEAGGPYRRKDVVFTTERVGSNPGDGLEGVRVAAVVEDKRPPKVVYDPSHPDADENGYVKLPNINVIEEMVNMMMAVRAYEANVATFNMSKGMLRRTLDLGRY